jgi:hypothetical protein
MAKIERSSITITSTGGDTIVLNDYTLSIEKIVFLVNTSSTEISTGFSDGTVNFTSNIQYGDTNMAKSITHYRNISGVKTKTFEAVVTMLDIGEFRINTTTCTQSTQIKFTAYGS